MMFASYELALNQEIQSKLRDEIMKVISSHGEITYEAINDMKYLEMVFSETMRKYPILDFQARQSVKDFPIPNTELVIPAKVFIMIPAYGLHHDERFWENPDKFDPERFNEVNVKKIVPFSYIPFSEGPRQCIGMR